MRLLGEAGKGSGPEVQKLPALYHKHSKRKDLEFMQYLMSVIYVESRFNRQAVSQADAYGLMQMTRIAVQESVDTCKLKAVPDMTHLFDSATNIRYGTCYLKKLIDDMGGDWTRALIVYNGGYAQLQRYDRGDVLVTETANYVIQVNRALGICKGVSTILSGK